MKVWGAPSHFAAWVVFASGAAAQPAYDEFIAKHAAANGVPEQLVRRVITIESGGDPKQVHKGNYGLMQIRLGTARAMGYDGDPKGLLDADTNMRFAVKYLAGAYRVAGCDANRAIALYQRGYHGLRAAKCRAQRALAEAKPTAPVPTRDFRLAHAQTRLATQPEPAAPSDVLKPRVVHTLAISWQSPLAAASNAPQQHLNEAKADAFATRATMIPVEEPVTTGARASPEPEPIVKPAERHPNSPAVNAESEPIVKPAERHPNSPAVNAESETIAKPAEPKPIVNTPATNEESESIAKPPTPRVEPEPLMKTPVRSTDSALLPKRDRRKTHQSVIKHAMASRPERATVPKRDQPGKNLEAPLNLISYLKKLVSPEPEQPARKRGTHAKLHAQQ